MAAATAVTVNAPGKAQFASLFDAIFTVSATLDAGSLADGAGESDTVAVPGVALGDMVLGISLNVDVVGMTITGYVSAADVVTIRIQNESGAGPVDLASKTLKVIVGRPSF